MTDHFEGLRIHADHLHERCDPDWDFSEQGEEHRVKVLRALQEAAHDVQVMRALHQRETGQVPTEEDDRRLWAPVWNGLRDCMTRQDLMRWVMDYASVSMRERAVGTVVRMHEELAMLDDDSGAWWLTRDPTENPG